MTKQIKTLGDESATESMDTFKDLEVGDAFEFIGTNDSIFIKLGDTRIFSLRQMYFRELRYVIEGEQRLDNKLVVKRGRIAVSAAGRTETF